MLLPVLPFRRCSRSVSSRVFGLLATITIAGPAQLASGQDITCSYELTIPSPEGAFGIIAINDAGLGVGATSAVNPQPCIWTADGGMMVLPKPAGVSGGSAVAVNNNNWILVDATGSPAFRGYVLIPTAPMQWGWIPMIPNAGNLGWSWVTDINDSNQVVGFGSYGSETSYLYPYRGFVWSIETGRVDLPIGDWKSSEFTGINESGVICGTVSNANVASGGTLRRAAVIVDDILTTIEPPIGYDRTAAVAINDAAVVGVHAAISGPLTTGLFYDSSTGVTTVLPAPAGFTRWTMRDLNNAGVAGGLGIKPGNTNQYPVLATAESSVDALGLFPGALYGEVRKVENDGRLVATLAFPGLGPKSLIASPVASSPDLDCDGTVGAEDLAILLGSWGRAGSADLDGDGIVNGPDLGLLLSAWTG